MKLKNKAAVLILALFAAFVLGVVWAVTAPNTTETVIYIDRQDTPDSLFYKLNQARCVKNKLTLAFVKTLQPVKKVYPGKYVVKAGMSNRALLNLFKYGLQTEISFRFGNNILPHELYAALGNKFESDSAAFAGVLQDTTYLNPLGLDSISSLALFWSDTYRFPWSITPDKMALFFVNDQQKFWDSERFNKLTRAGFTATREAYILASVIEKEAMKTEELARIAGVYINRLRIGMPLQADPTVKYAAGIRSMKRVSGILDIESPYNTYLNKGLPPGPIGIATKKGVDAVLNFEPHDYLYFCAREDFSGYHTFSKTYKEHQKAALLYRSALDRRNIR